MALEWTKSPANENLTTEELRQQRKHKLIEYGALVMMVHEWSQRRIEEIKPENSPGMQKSQRLMIEATVTAVQNAVVAAEVAIQGAEGNVDDTEIFDNARRLRDALYAIYIEAEFNL